MARARRPRTPLSHSHSWPANFSLSSQPSSSRWGLGSGDEVPVIRNHHHWKHRLHGLQRLQLLPWAHSSDLRSEVLRGEALAVVMTCSPPRTPPPKTRNGLPTPANCSELTAQIFAVRPWLLVMTCSPSVNTATERHMACQCCNTCYELTAQLIAVWLGGW